MSPPERAWPERGYALGVAAHRALHRMGLLATDRLPTPTLAVGALRAGGSGKTPVSLALARQAAALGADVAVISRGYRRDHTAPALAFDTRSPTRPDVGDVGDEAAEAALRLQHRPVVGGRIRWAVAADRRRAWDLLADAGRPDLVLLDDGWSHWRLRHDALIVLMAPGDTHARLLPCGPLRLAPDDIPRDALRWSHGPTLAPVHEGSPVASTWRARGVVDEAGRTTAASDLGPCLLICATGHPAEVVRTQRRAGLDVRGALVRRDHHRWSRREARDIAARALEHGLEVVATGKDHVKLAPLWQGPPPLRWLDGEVEVHRGQAIVRGLLERLLGGGR